MSRGHWIATMLLSATALGGQVPDRGMVGNWSGDGQIVVNWTDQPSIHVTLVIQADGSVSGRVGDAYLTGARITTNRGPIGRFLHIKTDYIVSGKLEAPLIAAEHIQRDAVKMPLNWDGTAFTGSLHSSGSMFGGADSMVFTAFHLRLVRQPSA